MNCFSDPLSSPILHSTLHSQNAHTYTLPSRSAPFRPLPNSQSSCLKDSDAHYAELDTSVLELAPGPQTAVLGPGEAVEYAAIPLSPPEH